MLLSSLFLVSGASAQFHPVDKSSVVSFKIKNFGFSVGGSFQGLQGDIRFNPDSLPAARFDVTVEASSINTDNNMRDEHLRGEDYFDVKNHPRIRFVSQSVKPARKNEFEMTGSLTIKNTTRVIRFPFTAAAAEGGYLFTGSFKINRKDFGVGGSSTISDELTVELKVLAK